MKNAYSHIGKYAGFAALSLLALMLVPAPSIAASSPPTCTYTSISGVFVSPSGPFGAWSQTFDNPLGVAQQGALVQGAFAGTFTNNGATSPVTGAWSYNTATGKLLIKVAGPGFSIDYAFLNLPTPGFTFQGVLHMAGSQPVPMVESPVVVPITCS